MSRRRDIEFLRIIATFLVVWYHCPSDLPDIAYSGLIFFVIVSTHFSVLEAAVVEYVSGRRIGRILGIWLIWYCVYAAISVMDGKINHYLGGSVGALLLVGPAVHLWYLPFLAAVLSVSTKIALVLRRPILLVGVGAFYSASMWLVDEWRPWAMGLGVPWAQYVHALPAISVGVLFAAASKLDWQARAAFLLFMLTATLPAWHAVGVGVTYFAGVALAGPILLVWRQGWLVTKFAPLSKYMLGIYLIHPILIRGIRHVLEADGVVLATLVFLLSLAAVAGIYALAPRIARAVM